MLALETLKSPLNHQKTQTEYLYSRDGAQGPAPGALTKTHQPSQLIDAPDDNVLAPGALTKAHQISASILRQIPTTLGSNFKLSEFIYLRMIKINRKIYSGNNDPSNFVSDEMGMILMSYALYTSHMVMLNAPTTPYIFHLVIIPFTIYPTLFSCTIPLDTSTPPTFLTPNWNHPTTTSIFKTKVTCYIKQMRLKKNN
jgi:hypothetical protein